MDNVATKKAIVSALERGEKPPLMRKTFNSSLVQAKRTPKLDRAKLHTKLRAGIEPEMRRKRIEIIRRELAKGASYSKADATARFVLRAKYKGLSRHYDRRDPKPTSKVIQSSIASAFFDIFALEF